MCFSSTILVLGYLKNSGTMGTVYGQLCLGTLVLQDAASVLGIAVLSGLGSGVGTCVQVMWQIVMVLLVQMHAMHLEMDAV